LAKDFGRIVVKRIIIAILLVCIVGGFGYWYIVSNQAPVVSYRTAKVEKGDLRATITATGTIEPEEVIDVGAQVTGPIVSFGPDPRNIETGKDSGGKPIYKSIDYGSPVHKDTVLVNIDPSVYKAQVTNAEAQLESAKAALDSANAQVDVAKANLDKSNADLDRMRAQLTQAERDWERAQRLRPSGAVTDLDYDTTQATFLTNKSALAVGQATVAQNQAALLDSKANVGKAKAAVAASQAALDQAKVNLGYCTIRSPVEGVVVDRRVNTGQTVVSALSASSLFLLAKDLHRLQVWASVNEADIGNVHSGQNVTFTVDAYPGRTFNGQVAADQPRLNASMNQNVVTYTVVVTTDNKDGKLKPYMTANLQFEISKRSNVLLIANAALRYKPRPELVDPEYRNDYIASQRMKKPSTEGEPGANQAAAPSKESKHKGRLWVQEGEFLRPIPVQTGVTDGLTTEIVTGDIKENDMVVTGENHGMPGGGGNSNPFAPKLFNNNKKPS
jgi:HlyD family secretion protein